MLFVYVLAQHVDACNPHLQFVIATGNTSGRSRPGVWGSVKKGRAPKSLNCLNTQGCLRQLLDITQKWLLLIGQESGYFCCRTMRSFKESPQFINAVLYIINSENVWSVFQKQISFLTSCTSYT